MRAFSLVLALTLTAPFAHAEELADTGRPAPRFRLPVYNAKAVGRSVVGLDQYVGFDAQDKATKVVLLSFSASFCPPCRKELPWLQKIADKYKEQGLRILMVSIDDKEEGQKKMQALIDENRITFPVLKDRFKLVARRWLGVEAKLPSVFLVKPDGMVATTHRGYDEKVAKSLEAEIAAALGVEVGTPVAATSAP